MPSGPDATLVHGTSNAVASHTAVVSVIAATRTCRAFHSTSSASETVTPDAGTAARSTRSPAIESAAVRSATGA
ncbi:hypothetical protein QP157_20295 [Sphingomonas sp. LR61]|uniref:hypothetical protein n=1 Tax=Sphingomonas sp. LR61 TaxID=3050234 RepID=UPI002FE361DF